tara:strand:+ start:3475 stop:3963 length:489 start_codon:yes stop_codon:yes gene_type:complete
MTGSIEHGTVASVHYTGTFAEGGEFDSSKGKDPLVFLVGFRQMIAGFEREILGAKVGEKREFTLAPEDAYGERNEDAIQKIERENFPEGMELEVGMVVGAHSDQGPIQFTIMEIDEEMVTADFNHQMAGRTLRFEVEVVDIRAATDEELAHGHVHGPGGHHH